MSISFKYLQHIHYITYKFSKNATEQSTCILWDFFLIQILTRREIFFLTLTLRFFSHTVWESPQNKGNTKENPSKKDVVWFGTTKAKTRTCVPVCCLLAWRKRGTVVTWNLQTISNIDLSRYVRNHKVCLLFLHFRWCSRSAKTGFHTLNEWTLFGSIF